VRHRLEISGAQRPLFPPALMRRLYRLSGGVPRVINVLCDRSLLGTYVQGKERVDRATLAQAAREVFHQPRRRSLVQPLMAILVLMLVGLLALKMYQLDQADAGIAAASAARPAPGCAGRGGRGGCAEGDRGDAGRGGGHGGVAGMAGGSCVKRQRCAGIRGVVSRLGADYRGADACRQAEILGLRCYSARGGLDELRAMNLPAVLLLSDNQGREFQAMLSALDRDSASFALGDRTRTIPIAHWRRNGRASTPCSGACRRRRATTCARATAGRRSPGSRASLHRRRVARPSRQRTRCSTSPCCAR